ncbi:MAG TPA: hypothetical protein PKY82_02740 [Pyrinomonadaceae bacterium]|nr:hypothetical protein [Pyrinomonadaceae bacterium]
MKTINTLIILMLILGAITAVFAQTTANERFKIAQEAFDNSQYEKTLTLLSAIEKDFGKSPRIESLRALTLRDLNRPRDAYNSLLAYFKLTASMDLRNNETHKSLIELKDQLQKQLEKELLDEKKDLQKDREKNTNNELKESNQTKKADDDPLAEIDLWNKVKESNTASDYYLFIERFPNSVYLKSARQKMEIIKDSEWDKVKNSKDPFAIREFLKTNPNSAFAEKAKARMNMLAKSIISWETIRESKNVEDFNNYLNDFPDGVYTIEAKKNIIPYLQKDLTSYFSTKGATSSDHNVKFVNDCIAESKSYYSVPRSVYPYGVLFEESISLRNVSNVKLVQSSVDKSYEIKLDMDPYFEAKQIVYKDILKKTSNISMKIGSNFNIYLDAPQPPNDLFNKIEKLVKFCKETN